MKSPLIRFQRKCPSSAANHMLAPAPSMTSAPSAGSSATEPGRATSADVAVAVEESQGLLKVRSGLR